MSTNERKHYMKEYREKLNLSYRDLEKLLPVKDKDGSPIMTFQALEKNEKRNSKLKQEMIPVIAAALNITPYDLVYVNPNHQTDFDADLLQVAGYVDAGLAELFISQEDSQIDNEYLPYKDGHKYIGFRVRGPSMRPRFLEGEVLVFKPAENHRELINREVYITLTNGARLIKVLKNNPNGGYLLVSHNPAFEDIEIKESDILETRGFKGIA